MSYVTKADTAEQMRQEVVTYLAQQAIRESSSYKRLNAAGKSSQRDLAAIYARAVQLHNLVTFYKELVIEPLAPPLTDISPLVNALMEARHAFANYAQQHRAKGTSEADAKAETNERLFKMCDEALKTVEVKP